MLRRMVWKEVLLHVREARFTWVVGLFCGLVLLGLALLGWEYRERLEAYRAGVTAEQRQLFSVDRSAPVRQQVLQLMNERGVYAFRPPQPLGPLATGFEPATPWQIHVLDRSSWSRQASEAFYRNPLLSLFPRPDFAFLVASVMSLVALFFTFDAICGEKESGTLRVMFSTGISRDRVLLGKWMGAMLTLGIPFLLATGIGVLLLGPVAQVRLNGELLVRIAGIAGIALVYLSLFVTVGLLISVCTRRPSTSLLVCLATWVVVTSVLPNLLGSLGAVVAPAPAFQQVQMRKRAVDEELAKQRQRLARLVQSGGLSEAERGRRLEALQAENGMQKARIDEQHRRQLDRQAQVSQALSRISPTACFSFAAAELADTGLHFYDRAHEGFALYQQAFREYARQLKQNVEKLDADWLKAGEVPALTFPAGKVGGAFEAATTDLLVLALFQVLAFAGAYVRFLKYDVR